MQKLSLSIAVIVHNEAKNICALLESIAAVDTAIVTEILVVDNASTDHTIELVHQWQKTHRNLNIRIKLCSINHMALARNVAIAEAVSPWIYFIDGDCRLTPQAWQSALSLVFDLANNEKIAAIGGGNVTPLTSSFVSQGLNAFRKNWWGHMGSIQMTPPKTAMQVELLSTCNMFVNTASARQCGGFDPIFSRVGEDLSLCHRLKQAGGQLWAFPGIEVIHEQDKGLLAWCRKVFFYGKAQIDIAVRYPRHFAGRRGLQFIFLGILPILVFLKAEFLFFFLGGYTVLLLQGFYKSSLNWRERGRGAVFILISQAAYAVGELSAILFLLLTRFLSLPKKMPDLDSAKNITSPGHR